MTYEWPQGWVPIHCVCDALIGGYLQQHQPELIEIHHNCNTRISNYYVTTIVK